jgi:formylglycine-generating enzyme required for sulfatase activity
MTPERWQRVKEVLGVALEEDEAGRASLLEQIRTDDPELAREVASLIDAYEGTRDEPIEGEGSAGRVTAGSRLGHYEVIELLGVGGMGEVYRAHDHRLGRDVAVKVLPRGLSAHPRALKRLEREARTVAALSHPNIVAIHDFEHEGGTAYAVMELLAGESLRARLARGPLPARTALEWARQIVSGLRAAHEKGIVHRDLKPENLFVTSGGMVKILDFGIAKQSQIDPLPGDEPLEATRPGQVLGTVGYMSPEQVRAAPVDARADMFSFGVVLAEMLSGQRPFHRDSAAETLAAILRDPPAGLDAAEQVFPALARIARRCLERRPEDRYGSTADLAVAIEAVPWQEVTSGGGRRRRWMLLTAAALALLGAALSRGAWPRYARTPHASSPAILGSGPLPVARSPLDGAEYIQVPAGGFTMGCTPAADHQLRAGSASHPEGCGTMSWALPSRRIAMKNPYWIMRTEVTAAQFTVFARAARRVMPDPPVFNPDWRKTEHPIVNVTWFDARDYCAWAGGRLPSDAEWERAARASQDWAFVWGPSERPLVEGRPRANVRDESYERKYGLIDDQGGAIARRANGYDDGYPDTSPVTAFPANDFGLFDMGGNVAEWVEDEADPLPLPGHPADDLTKKPVDGSAREDGSEVVRVLRSGAWQLGPIAVFDRMSASPYGKASVTGFRCARDGPP